MPSIFAPGLVDPNPAPADPLEQVEMLYEFLQGRPPAGVSTVAREQPKLSPRQAFAVIWFLQEKLGLLPDTIERCCSCNELFDTDSSGWYVERLYRHYCDDCLPHRYEGIAS